MRGSGVRSTTRQQHSAWLPIRVLPVLAMVLVGGLVGVLGLGGGKPASADVFEFVEWYAVQSSYQGQPENLSEIALRFLGAATRSTEIFNLNVGRQQPDGASLTNPDKLHAGWLLVLPWDAVGPGVMYGALPTVSPPQVSGGPGSQASAGSGGAAAPRVGAAGSPGSAPITVVPTVRPSNAVPAGSGGHCLAASASSSPSDWAAQRLAPDQAWSQTRGKGQLVAIIDSGVDGSLPQLGGHLAVGANVVDGTGRGDTDCLGTGTAMAGIIAAQPDQGDGMVGMAPDATVLPIRIATTSPSARPSDEARAIEVAVSAGATVVALGSYVNVDDPGVAQAITQAAGHNVVVVYAAPTGATGAPVPSSSPATAAPAGGGVLSVGAVGVDGQLGADYLPGSVTVVAPGLNVMTLGTTGTGTTAGSGTQYAVAFVAGEAALVRAAHPNLTAVQVVQQVERTSDSQSGGAPDKAYGWGLINPTVAVKKVLSDDPSQQAQAAHGPATGSSSSTASTVVIVLGLVIGLAGGALLATRIRHMIRSGAGNRDSVPGIDDDRGDPDGSRPRGEQSRTDGPAAPRGLGDDGDRTKLMMGRLR